MHSKGRDKKVLWVPEGAMGIRCDLLHAALAHLQLKCPYRMTGECLQVFLQVSLPRGLAAPS
jgi:hypothetical protein